MKLKTCVPILLTDRGCPLAFDVADDHGNIGRATYQRWDTLRGQIWYRVTITVDGKPITGDLIVQAKCRIEPTTSLQNVPT